MPKIYKHLFEQITSFENLLSAAHLAQKGKRKHRNVQQFHFNLENELFDLQRDLRNKTYQPDPHRNFYIFDPKKRLISASSYPDRVVHHALCRVIQPIFEKALIFDTYANRKGKGTHKAIRRAQKFLRQTDYYLKCDIAQYFPNIRHDILKTQIRQKIACADTLWLIDCIIDNYRSEISFLGEMVFLFRGLPIGNLTSQYFANSYLNGFDRFVKEELKCRFYVRYVDDFVIFGNNKKELQTAKEKIQTYLSQYLDLHLHENKSKVSQTQEGITFLGQRIFKNYRLLKKERLRIFKKKLNQKLKKYQKGELSFTKLQQSLNAWLGHSLQADTYFLRKQVKNAIIEKKQSFFQYETVNSEMPSV